MINTICICFVWINFQNCEEPLQNLFATSFLDFIHILHVFEALNGSKLEGFLHILLLIFYLYSRMHTVKIPFFLHWKPFQWPRMTFFNLYF